jgi:hypothetical protein
MGFISSYMNTKPPFYIRLSYGIHDTGDIYWFHVTDWEEGNAIYHVEYIIQKKSKALSYKPIVVDLLELLKKSPWIKQEYLTGLEFKKEIDFIKEILIS